jgi:hypothetical protein
MAGDLSGTFAHNFMAQAPYEHLAKLLASGRRNDKVSRRRFVRMGLIRDPRNACGIGRGEELIWIQYFRQPRMMGNL